MVVRGAGRTAAPAADRRRDGRRAAGRDRPAIALARRGIRIRTTGRVVARGRGRVQHRRPGGSDPLSVSRRSEPRSGRGTAQSANGAAREPARDPCRGGAGAARRLLVRLWALGAEHGSSGRESDHGRRADDQRLPGGGSHAPGARGASRRPGLDGARRGRAADGGALPAAARSRARGVRLGRRGGGRGSCRQESSPASWPA